MLSYTYLFDLALILLSTKLFGLATKKFKMPQVVGALVAGVVLGPAVFNIISETEFIQQMAELGVIVLMFTAGLETDLNQLKKTGKASFIVACFGVLVPLIGGTLLAYAFNSGSGLNGNELIENIFIGVILTATSVSITVETLRELGKLNGHVGSTILGAALIDDIIGIVALTIITSVGGDNVNVILVLGKILLFFIMSIIVGIAFYKLFNKFVKRYKKDRRRFVILAFVICLLFSFVAERFFGVADITGAFIAGMIISNNRATSYITARFETLSYILLSPIFFASIGIKVKLPEITPTVIVFSICLIIVAIITKLIGGAVGAKICKFTNVESIQVGVGMASRGEVALVVANKGLALGIMNPNFLAPVIIMVVFIAITTPILLKMSFKLKEKKKVVEEEATA